MTYTVKVTHAVYPTKREDSRTYYASQTISADEYDALVAIDPKHADFFEADRPTPAGALMPPVVDEDQP